jgi:hypothetical protein
VADNNSSGGKGGSGGDNNLLITPGVTAEIHPRGLLSAIGYIEMSYANERGGCVINPEFLTTPQRIEFMEVGGRSSFASGLVMALLSPLAIGVLDRYVPIFGSYNPSGFDQFCGVLLALIFPLCYAFLFASAAVKHLGGYSRGMVNNLLAGMAIASIVKAVIAFIAFHFIYFKLLSDTNIAWALRKLYTFKMSPDTAVRIFLWIKDFKNVFITSSYFVLISSIIFISIPYLAFLWAGHRNKKLLDAGVVTVFNEADC